MPFSRLPVVPVAMRAPKRIEEREMRAHERDHRVLARIVRDQRDRLPPEIEPCVERCVGRQPRRSGQLEPFARVRDVEMNAVSWITHSRFSACPSGKTDVGSSGSSRYIIDVEAPCGIAADDAGHQMNQSAVAARGQAREAGVAAQQAGGDKASWVWPTTTELRSQFLGRIVSSGSDQFDERSVGVRRDATGSRPIQSAFCARRRLELNRRADGDACRYPGTPRGARGVVAATPGAPPRYDSRGASAGARARCAAGRVAGCSRRAVARRCDSRALACGAAFTRSGVARGGA